MRGPCLEQGGSGRAGGRERELQHRAQALRQSVTLATDGNISCRVPPAAWQADTHNLGKLAAGPSGGKPVHCTNTSSAPSLSP